MESAQQDRFISYPQITQIKEPSAVAPDATGDLGYSAGKKALHEKCSVPPASGATALGSVNLRNLRTGDLIYSAIVDRR